MTISLPAPAEEALRRLNDAGFDAFVVGGCVRDTLLQRVPGDWDVTTSAMPGEVEAVFSGERVIETGIKHGTVTVLLSGMPLEITTYRVDGEYKDNRHPEDISFTRNLTEDLARRDFTVNAMAYNPTVGLVDEYGGQEDLQNQVIRCVGDPDTRFGEDALRILRALRFASVLGFSIFSETADAIHRNRERIRNVSAERVTAELEKFLCGNTVTELLLEYSDLFCEIFPELSACVGYEQKNRYHRYDLYEHIARAVGYAEPIFEVRLTMLLHDIGKPETMSEGPDGQHHFYGHAKESANMAKSILRRMRLPAKTQRMVSDLIYWHDVPLTEDPKLLKRRLNKMGEETLRLLLKVQRADRLAQSEFQAEGADAGYDALSKALDALLETSPAVTVGDLAIDGNDLLDLGLAGPEIGEAEQELLGLVMDDRLPNERQALLQYLREKGSRNGPEKDRPDQ